METIKVQIQQPKEIKVTLPAFRKYGGSYFKVISTDNVIQVNTYDHSSGIEMSENNNESPFLYGSKDIPEQEFYEAFNSTLEKIKQWNTPT